MMSPLKRLEQYSTALFKLGKISRIAKQADRNANNLAKRLDHGEGATDVRFSQIEGTISQGLDNTARQNKIQEAEAARAFSDLSRRMDLLLLHWKTPESIPTVNVSHDELLKVGGFQTFMDSFYHRLENRFRGTTAEIKNRLRIYLPDVESAVMRTGGKPVLDIGCGRGEWLELMHDCNIIAVGIDTNPVQIERVRTAGRDAREGDALTALQKAEDNSYSVITAHHLIEHLPFDQVAWITREALRVLAPGGVLIFETPNPRNILVGATSFHNDPTHLRPLTEPVLSVLFDTAGFYPADVRHLHPHERLDEFLSRPAFDNELANLLFGAQDLAIIGTKPEKGN